MTPRGRSPKKRGRQSQSTQAQRGGSAGGSLSTVAASLTEISLAHRWIVLGPAIFLLLASLDFLWVTEDAFITFQSVENVWTGHGPVFNHGLRVESFSHPLWFLMLCVMRAAGADTLPLLSALTGILLSILGLVLASEASRRRFEGEPHLMPFGAIVVAALYPFWQFASSGLETGLTFFWIGLSSLCLVLLSQGVVAARIITFFVLGLAAIVRPDLAVISLPLLGVAIYIVKKRRSSWGKLMGYILLYSIPGAVWQLFRMGYYAALVPNTYIAKEGLGSYWERGFTYLFDLLNPYYLLPVLVAGLLLTGFGLYKLRVTKQIVGRSLVVSAFGVAALIHGALVCRAGGDFMHARLLLPALFALAAMFAVVPLPKHRYVRWGIIFATSLWAAYASLLARPSYGPNISDDGIADERQWYIARSRIKRPVSIQDYSFHSFYRIGAAISAIAREKGFRAVLWGHIGISAAVIPDDIIVIDSLTLNDHIGSRLELTKRSRPGHEKITPASWFLARYPKNGFVPTNQLGGIYDKEEPQESIDMARRVLDTPTLRELHEAVSAPLTTEVFLKNIVRAWRLTFIRIPPDPMQAAKRFNVEISDSKR